MWVCLNGLLSTQEGFLSPAPLRLLPQSHRQRIETFEGPKISVCVQGLQIKWILPLKWDARPYFLPVLELKHVWERERYDMLISDSRTIGIRSEEKTSSKLSCGDTEGETLRPAENVAIPTPTPKKGCSPDPRREKKLKWIIWQKERNVWLLDCDLHSTHNNDVLRWW